ncbi:hypothetical protein CC1G_08810 [Coprinopsis cinerea okayama7|uniref:Uncharacterized protein n=1 Tax=Coprinopsis cinerea (strain Okayama-7 / 130 / ATCC MYA-4618 / FGSC 9003) TaxID=240176 RepID=A8N460_COPC7|nr:hypothetical protein CC1G_08810 [Coprinopsis cinerea okayama7\|eukprot:XP_001829655.1 hypothetical protein CC1G_08810 [Coprinopsis cinerea okayama7\
MAPRKGKKNSKSNVEQPQAEGQRPVGCSPRFAHADSKAKDTAKTTLDSLKETTREMVIRELEANPATRGIVKDKERLDKVVDECLRDSLKNSEKKIANISYKVMDRACTNAVIHTPFSAADDKTLKELDVEPLCIGPLTDKRIKALTDLVSRKKSSATVPITSEPCLVPDSNKALVGEGEKPRPAEGDSTPPRRSNRIIDKTDTEPLAHVAENVWKSEGKILTRNFEYVMYRVGQASEARSRTLIDLLIIHSGRTCEEQFRKPTFSFLELNVGDSALKHGEAGGPVEVPSAIRGGHVLSFTGRLDYATAGTTPGLAGNQQDVIQVKTLAELRKVIAGKLPGGDGFKIWILEAKRLMSIDELNAHLPQIIAQTIAVMKAAK